MCPSPSQLPGEPSAGLRWTVRGLVPLLAVLAYGVVLRVWDLGTKPFWADEAETCINALTILEHGLPGDHYLGQPLYENALTRPWPESAEYEFKDSSYSDHGLAIYHGWLPLYATATAFALAGVGPDQDGAVLRVRHSAEEMHRRTVVGRLPAVAFGGVFLVALFAAGWQLYGIDAGWAALAAGTVATPAVLFSRQARYYSPALAITACCGLLIGRMVRRGRWRDFLLGAVVLVLLFHTHTLSFVAACAACGLTLPSLVRRARGLAKLAAFAGLLAVGVVPWIVLTGFARAAAAIPPAWSLLAAEDLFAVPRLLRLSALLVALTLAWLLVTKVFRARLPDGLARPFADHRQVFLLLAGWGLAAVLTFIFFVPAVSYFYGRMVLTVFVPGVLFVAVLSAAVARACAPRHPALLAPCLPVLGLVMAGQATFWAPAPDPAAPSPFPVIEHLRTLEIRPGTRIYATPNDHLTLTFYTGLPVQSVAPVRKTFLDRYEGELLIIEAGPRYERLTAEEIRRALSATGQPPSEGEARRLESLLATRLLREELRGRVANVTPPLGPPDPALPELFLHQRRMTATAVERWVGQGGNPMFKGYNLADYHWWQVFYYRFVQPEARMGGNLNYANRVRHARAVVLPGEWVLYHCPAPTEPAAPSATIR